MARSWSQTEGRAKKRRVGCLWGEATRPRIGGGLSSGSPLLAEMNGSEGGWILYFRAGREVKARREDRPPGKEEGKKVLSSISTSFSRRWKSRPAQRITGVVSPLRFANKEVILDDFPFLPRLSSPFDASAFPFYNIPGRSPFQSLRKKKDQ